MTSNSNVIQGSGGGGAQKEPRKPREAPNTLQSAAKAKILDLIQFGQVKGLAQGLRSIFLDDTPLINADGTPNFQGVRVQFREGLPDQEVIEGFRAVENVVDVSTQVKFDAPVIRSLVNSSADAAIVTIQLAALSRQNKDNGDLNGHSVQLSVDWRVNGGPWQPAVVDTIQGKTTSPYQRSYRLSFGTVQGQIDLRVSRQSPDDDNDSGVRSESYWANFTEVVDRKLSYPDMAMFAIEIDAQEFGNQMPSRTYDMLLSVIKVPSNYNPESRTYTGLWDGTFKEEWTDNPAWAFYDLATHPVIGADIPYVDKWALYRIGQYCDELVPNGRGGMEPRFTCNTIFSAQEDAMSALSTFASAFRGMVYWGTDTTVPVADMPEDPVKLVVPANVVKGEFTYTGTAANERHSVAVVMFNDPENGYELTPVVHEDPESVRLFGWKEVTVTAVACTSRGQALRLAKWILYSERMEKEVVTYVASVDHADLRPGNIIQIADPDRAAARLGGRVLTTGTNVLELDAVPSVTSTGLWMLSVLMPNGTIERLDVDSFDGNTVTLAGQLSTEPVAGAVWVLSSMAVQPAEYRVTEVTEEGYDYKITATEYRREKYAEVELGLKLPTRPNSLIPQGPLAIPSNLTAESVIYLAGGTEHQKLVVSWTPSQDARVVGYLLEVQGPGELTWRTAYNGPTCVHDELDAQEGQWLIRVRAVNGLGVASQWIVLNTYIAGLLTPSPPTAVDLQIGTFSISLMPRSLDVNAQYEFWRSNVPLTTALIESNATFFSVSSNMVDAGLTPGTTYYYYIRGHNAYGVSDWYPIQATTGEDFVEIVAAVDADIRRPGGLFEQMVSEAVDSVGEGLVDQVADQFGTAVQDAADAAQQAQDSVFDVSSQVFAVSALSNIRHKAATAVREGLSSRALVEELTRNSEDFQLATLIQELSSQVDTNLASVYQELVTLATEDEALAASILALQAQVTDDIGAALTQESIVRAQEDAALAAQITALQAQVTDDIGAALTQESLVRAQEDLALAAQITALQAQVTDDIGAALTQESIVRAQEDSALAAQITALQAQVTDDIGAALTQESIVRAQEDAALASQITNLTASVDGQFASVSQDITAQAEYTDGAVARAVTTVEVNGKKAVFGISVEGEVAEIGVVADRFFIYNPIADEFSAALIVEGGQVMINSALIGDASITTAKIANASITSAKVTDLESSNYVANTSGWKLWKDGTFELNGSIAGQGRTKITHQAIQVFDGAGTKRVQLGNLSV